MYSKEQLKKGLKNKDKKIIDKYLGKCFREEDLTYGSQEVDRYYSVYEVLANFIRTSDVDAVKYILDLGFTLDYYPDLEPNLIFIAIENNNYDMFILLKDYGADMSSIYDGKHGPYNLDLLSYTILFVEDLKQSRIFNYLLDNGFDINGAHTDIHHAPINALATYALECISMSFVECEWDYLIELGLDLNYNWGNINPLIYHINTLFEEGHIGILHLYIEYIKWLIENGATLIEHEDKIKYEFILAIITNDVEFIKNNILVFKNKYSFRLGDDITILDITIFSNQEVIRLIIESFKDDEYFKENVEILLSEIDDMDEVKEDFEIVLEETLI